MDLSIESKGFGQTFWVFGVFDEREESSSWYSEALPFLGSDGVVNLDIVACFHHTSCP